MPEIAWLSVTIPAEATAAASEAAAEMARFDAELGHEKIGRAHV